MVEVVSEVLALVQTQLAFVEGRRVEGRVAERRHVGRLEEGAQVGRLEAVHLGEHDLLLVLRITRNGRWNVEGVGQAQEVLSQLLALLVLRDVQHGEGIRALRHLQERRVGRVRKMVDVVWHGLKPGFQRDPGLEIEPILLIHRRL